MTVKLSDETFLKASVVPWVARTDILSDLLAGTVRTVRSRFDVLSAQEL
jgi:hypothetical protein